MVIWVIKFFPCSSSVYSCHLFLISSASVRSLPFLSFIVSILAWNIPLVYPVFSKRSLVFPILLFSAIPLYCSFILYIYFFFKRGPQISLRPHNPGPAHWSWVFPTAEMSKGCEGLHRSKEDLFSSSQRRWEKLRNEGKRCVKGLTRQSEFGLKSGRLSLECPPSHDNPCLGAEPHAPKAASVAGWAPSSSRAAGLHASTAAALWTTRWQQTPSFLLAAPRFLVPSCQTLVFPTNTPSALSFPLRKQGMLLSNPGLVIDKLCDRKIISPLPASAIK